MMELAKREERFLEKEEKKLFIQKTSTIVTFYLGNFLFGIPAERVTEINKDIDVTPVPLSEDYILGIVNLRGQIVTVINLAKRIGLDKEIIPKLGLIIKKEGEAPVSFVIEEIGEILEIPVTRLEKPPEKVEGLDKEFIKSIYQLSDKLLLILDVEKIIEF